MNNNDSNRTYDGSNLSSSHFTIPVSFSLSELNSEENMDSNYDENAFPDIDFKPGADFEVDETLFQGMTMKEDFLDFRISGSDHMYCNTTSENQVSEIHDVGNEVEIQEDIALFQDAGDDINQPVVTRIRIENSRVLSTPEEETSADRKKACQVPVVKTYNMRSKRLGVDEGKIDLTGRNSAGKGGQTAKKRKVDQRKMAKNDEDEDDEEEEEEEDAEDDEVPESDEDEIPQSKRKIVPAKKGAKAKAKRKGKAAKGKKPAKGKSPKKIAKQESSEEEDEGEDEEAVEVPRRSKSSKLKERGKGKGRPKKKQMESSEEEEEEEEEEEDDDEEEDDSESDEETEVPQKSGRGKQKRTAKGKLKQPAAKKKKPAKKSKKKAARASGSDTSSDSLPLQEIKKQNKTKTVGKSGRGQKRIRKDESEENSGEEEEDEMENTRTGPEKRGIQDSVLSALPKGFAVLTDDDSTSICSNDGSTAGVRTSSRIKKPNRLYLAGHTGSQATGKATTKKEKPVKGRTADQQNTNVNLDHSETTDTDALIIDESPVKIPAASASSVSKPGAFHPEANEKETEQPESVEYDEKDLNSKRNDELSISSGQMVNESTASKSSDNVKRSVRLKHLEEAHLEKFKPLKAERERLEGKTEVQKKKNLDKIEPEIPKEENPKQVTKEALKPNVAATAVKNPCRGPNCGNGSLTGSVYCGDNCIQNHAEESIRLIEQERLKSQPQRSRNDTSVTIAKSEERIVVFERKTGKLLTGPVAPTESTLLAWLKKHPTFEVLQPSNHSPSSSVAVKKDKKPENKKITKDVRAPVSKEPVKAPVSVSVDPDHPTHGGTKEDKKTTTSSAVSGHVQQLGRNSEQTKPVVGHREYDRPPPRSMGGESGYLRGGPDPARISIRNTLRETLLARANETDDVMLSGSEIKRLALDIEQELFGYYGEVNTKYKHKYRTLITHLKDTTNKGLFRKVLFGEVRPNRLVRLSSENLGSRELAYWKDPNAKVSSKFSKENTSEPKPAKKAEFPLPPKSPFYDPSYDYLSSIIVDTTSNHGNHFFDINCKICTGKIPEPMYYDASKSVSTTSFALAKEDVIMAAAIDVEPPVAAKVVKDDDHALTAAGPCRDPRRSKAAVAAGPSGSSLAKSGSKSDEKPALLPTPKIMSPIQTEVSTSYRMGAVEPLVLWKGFVYAHDVTKVAVCAYLVSGSLSVLKEDLSDLVVISGRLPPDNVFNYLWHIKQSGTFHRDVAVLRFESASSQNNDLYHRLFEYLHSRDRCGVVSGCSGPTVKDMYIVPVAAGYDLPPVLLPSDGPGLPDNHPNLLLGVILKHTSKRPGMSSPGSVKPSVSTKTWMYSERSSEAREEYGPDTHFYGPGLGTKQREKSGTEQKPNLVVSEDAVAAESSEASDVDEDLSEVASKDPIVSRYSKFEKTNKKSFKKSAFGMAVDDDKPYDPFDDEEDKPYDPSSPEFVATTKVTMAAAAVSASSAKYASSSSTVSLTSSSSAVLPTPATSVADGIDAKQLFKPMNGSSNATDMTTAMLTTLAAISTTSNADEQRRLLSELTDRINEQKLNLDKERQDLKNEESLGLLSGNQLSNTDFAKSNRSDSSEGPKSLFQFTSAAGNFPGLSQSEVSSSIGVASGDSLSSNMRGISNMDHTESASNLSHMPVDSAAIMNLARKRLAQKAGDPHQASPKVESTASSLDDKTQNLPAPSDDVKSDKTSVETAEKSRVETNPASFSCNISILPQSIQQLLSGSSFENLKNIVANVTGKKVSDVSERKSSESANNAVAAVNRYSDVSKNDDNITSEESSGNRKYQNSLPADFHGDIDYRIPSGSSDGYEGQSDSRNRADTRAQSSNSALPSLRSASSALFRPSMQALLETPAEFNSKNSSEVKQPLLKTPQMPGNSDKTKPPLPPEMNQPPFPPYMQPPSFLKNLSRPLIPGEPSGLHLHSDESLQPEVLRPPLLPDVPKPPFPPHLARPPFQPGMPRPSFLLEPPRPPVMPDHLRYNVPTSSGRNETTLPSQAPGSINRSGSSGLLPHPSPGNATAKGQTEKSCNDFSSPSDRFFIPQSIGPRNAPKSCAESGGADTGRPFAMGEVLKHLNSTKTSQSSMVKSTSTSALADQPRSSSSSSSDDRERKVLLPTPSVLSKQKSGEHKSLKDAEKGSREKRHERTDRGRASLDGRKQETSSRGAVVVARKWSAKSDWEKKKSNKSENSSVILIDDDPAPSDPIELNQIPLPPPTKSQDGDITENKTEDEKPKESRAAENKSAETKQDEDKSRPGDRSSKDKSYESRRHGKQSERSRSRSGERGKRSVKENLDSRSRLSSRFHRGSRAPSRQQRQRDRFSKRRSRSKERPSSYRSRSSDKRSNDEPQRRLSRDRRRGSPLAEVRKRDDSLGKDRVHHGLDRIESERNATQLNSNTQIPGTSHETKPSILGVPPLMKLMEANEPQIPKPPVVIPSLLDIMGVSRDRVAHARAVADLKQVKTGSLVPGLLGMTYSRDYKHGADSDDSGVRERRAPTTEEELFDPRDLADITERRSLLGRYQHGEFPYPSPFERRDFAAETGEGASVLMKRPLIDRPPEGDFERLASFAAESAADEAKFSGAGFRYTSDRVDEKVEGRRRNEDPGAIRLSDPMQMHPVRPFSFSAESRFDEKAAISAEIRENEGRFFNPAMLKKSLLGDYPDQDQDGVTPDEAHGERNIAQEERQLKQSPVEAYNTGGGQQSPSLQIRPPFPRSMTGIHPGYGPLPAPRPPPVGYDERGAILRPRQRMPRPPFGVPPDLLPPPVPESQLWRNAASFPRPPETRGQPFPQSDSDADGALEKKTLLPVPPASGSPLPENPVFMGPGPRPQAPMRHRIDGPPFMPHRGPGARMPPRLRHPGFPEGSRPPGPRPMNPGDPRFRGQFMH